MPVVIAQRLAQRVGSKGPDLQRQRPRTIMSVDNRCHLLCLVQVERESRVNCHRLGAEESSQSRCDFFTLRPLRNEDVTKTPARDSRGAVAGFTRQLTVSISTTGISSLAYRRARSPL